MKQGFWKRFLAVTMAIAIVLSTGVLDSAGWLLASNGEGTSQEGTVPGEEPGTPEGQQGGTTTEELDLGGETGEGSDGAALIDDQGDPAPEAQFTATFNFTYPNGDVVTLTAANGGYAPTVEAPEKSGHSFLGWIDQNGAPLATGTLALTESVVYNLTPAFQQIFVATFNFTYPDGTVVTHHVSNGDAAPVVADAQQESGKFYGWIDQNGAALITGTVSITEDTVYNLTPVFQDVYFVYFLDHNSKIVATKEGKPGDTFAADVVLSGLAEEEEFLGWFADSALTIPVTSVTISEEAPQDIYIYAKVNGGCWITYDPMGGSNVDPVFFTPTQVPTAPEAPEKVGYKLSHWSLTPDGEDFFATNTTPLQSNITLYAVWTPNEDTAYTVIFWRQVNDDPVDNDVTNNNYDFAEAVTRYGTTGEEVAIIDADKAKADVGKYLGFYYSTRTDESAVEIAPDGSSVLNVYYDRHDVTITFYDVDGVTVTHVTTGLYGGSFEDYGFEWPNIREIDGLETVIYFIHSSNIVYATHANYVNGHPNAAKGETVYTDFSFTALVRPPDGVPMPIYLFNQNLDGVTYPDEPAFTWPAYFGDKYTPGTPTPGFTACKYIAYFEDGTQTGEIKTTPKTKLDSKTIQSNNGGKVVTRLDVFFARDSYTIFYYDFVIEDGTRIQKQVNKEVVYIQTPLTDIETYGFELTTPPEDKAGYIFAGWYSDEGGISKFEFNGKMPLNNIALYAKWVPPVVNVDVLPEMDITILGTESSKLAATYGERIVLAELAKMPVNVPLNYEQKGWVVWNPETQDFEPFNLATKIYKDIILAPNIVEKTAYNVYYKTNAPEGVTVTGTAPVDNNAYRIGTAAAVKTAKALNCDGYKFMGWNTEADGSGTAYAPGSTVAIEGDTVLYAIWAKNEAAIKIVYHANNGSGESFTDPTAYAANTYAPFQSNPYSYTYYEFLGWSTNAGATRPMTGASFFVRSGVEQYDLYAVWKRVEKQVSYTFEGVYPAGVALPETSMERIAETITVAPAPSAEGWVFNGWTTDDATVNGNTFVMPDNDVVFVGTWRRVLEVVITGNVVSETYDGTAKTATGYTVSFPESTGYSEDFIVFGGTASVTGTDVGSYPMGLTVEQFSNSKPTEFEVTFVVNDGGVEITKRDVVIQSGSATKEYDGTPLTSNNWSATGFVNGEGAKVKTTGSQTLVGSSSNTIEYSLYEGTKADNYNITVIEGTLTVKDRTNKYEITATSKEAFVTFDGIEFILEGLEATKFEVEGNWYYLSGLNSCVKATDAGKYLHEITGTAIVKDAAGNDVTAQFIVHEHEKYLNIAPKPLTIRSASGYKTYDGTPLTNSNVSAYGFAMGNGATYDVTGSQTNVGSSENFFTYTLNEGTKAENYIITVVYGKLEVAPCTDLVTVTITENSDTFKYDGTEHTVTGYTVSIDNDLYTEDDFVFTGDATVKGTDAGTYNMGLSSDDFENISKNFTNVVFVVEDGQLVIGKREVTLTSATDSKIYDGTALTNDTVTVGGDGFVTGEGATYDVTGSQTGVGSSANTFTYALNEGTKAGNYEITMTEGTLSVTPVTEEVVITIREKSGTYVYDGTEKTVSGYTVVSISNPLYKQSGIVFNGDATVKGTNVGTYDMLLTSADFSNGDSFFTNVKFVIEDGQLEITPKPITIVITGNTGESDYNGGEQKVEGYEVEINDPLYKEENIGFGGDDVVTGEDVGEYPMGLTPEDFTNNDPNFEVTFEVIDGGLTINKKAITVTVTGNSETKTFNGEEQSVTGYEIQISDELYTEDLIDFTGEAIAKGTNVGSYPMGLTKDQFENTDENFEVTFVVEDGNLNIVADGSVVVKIKGNYETFTYNGTEHTVTGYVIVDISSDLYTAADFTGPAGKSVARTAAGETAMGLKASDFTNINSNFSNVTFIVEDGGIKVLPADVTVTVTGNSDSKVYNGTEQSVTGYTVDIDGALYTESDFTYSGEATAKGTNKGEYPMGLKAEDFSNENPNFNVTFVVEDGQLEITPKPITIVINGNTDETDYNGGEQKVEGYEVENDEDLYDEDKIEFKGDDIATGEDVGEYPMGLTPDDFTNTDPNFDVTFEVNDGGLTINKKAISVTVKGNTDSLVYNGSEQKVEGYTVSISDELYTEDKIAFTGSAVAAGTDVAKYPMGLALGQFENTDENFQVTFTVIDGQLEITKKSVTLTSATDSKQYDGTPLTNKNVTAEGFVAGEGATYNVTGTQTNVGSSENLFTYTLNAGTKAGNYDIKTVNGTLTVLNRDAKFEIQVQANSGEFVYDGNFKTVAGLVSYKFTINGVEYTVSGLTAFQMQKNVGTTAVNVVGTAKVTAPDGTDVTAQFAVSTKPGTLKITPKNITVTITENSGELVYNGEEQIITGYDVTITDPLFDEDNIVFGGDDIVGGTDVGSYEMELKPEDFTNIDPNFTVTFEIEDGELEITKKPVEVIITENSATKVYNGFEQKVEGYTWAADTALYTAADFTFNGEAIAKGTEVGSYDMNVLASNFANVDDNFSVTFKVVDGKLTITPLEAEIIVTITEHSGREAYNGSEHTVTGYDVSINNTLYTVADFAFNGDATVTGTDAATYEMLLKASDFVNLNENFAKVTFVIVDGTLVIDPLNVTMVSGDAQKVYDGTALVCETVTATGFIEGEGATYTFTGSQTNVGSSNNFFTYALNANTKAQNYVIATSEGTLTVTPVTDKVTVTITEHSGNGDYNGAAQTVTGYDVSIDNELYTTADFTFSGNASVTGTDAGTYEMELIPENFVNISTNFSSVEFVIVDGSLVIDPLTVTMVSASDEKAYDGTALTNSTVTVTGFIAGEGAAYTVTGSQTLIGSSENEFTYELNANTKAENYVISTEFGILTITPPADFEIVEKTHDGPDSYALGDTVIFDITVENIFDAEATAVITEQEGVSILWNGQKLSSVTTTIPAGETLTVQAEYTIQEKDILAGEFTNVVNVKLTAIVNGEPVEGEDDDDDTVDKIDDPIAVLRLDKTTVSAPANGSKYVEGETIKYQIKLTNEGNLTLTDIVIDDVLTGALRSEDSVLTDPVNKTFALTIELAPGESYVIEYEHLVVESDLGKDLTNAVTGTANNPTLEDEDETNDIETDVIGDEVTDPSDDIVRGLDVEKTVTNFQDTYKLNTYIEYQIVVTNNGNVTESGVILTDTITAADVEEFEFTDLAGGTLMANNTVKLADLAPGETVILTARYWIVAADEATVIRNNATVDSSDGKLDDTDDAEPVKVEKLYDLTIFYFTDDWQLELAPSFHGRYSVGNMFFVMSPAIEGYEPSVAYIGSTPEGMPAEDLVFYVLYSQLPEPEEEPVDPDEDPTDPTDPEQPEDPTEPTYDITEIPDDPTPLGDVDLGDHTCCILHFLIMLVAMILLGFYTNDRKKRQAKIHELRRALEAEKASKGQV